jgi:DNA invertase Pin-like site-specific DNA recombinase
MSTEVHHKVSAVHLQRDAFLYVRQSSPRQVLENTESTKRQYALRERALALGWPVERIHVIDTDQGRSGAKSDDRDGFQRLVSEVAMGRAGIVLGLEVSRLARNNADWHRLLELCAMAGTLILDLDGIYDPAQFNDRLLLGLKGTMSEAELHLLKARLQGGQRNKAKRGELELPLPIGLVYAADGVVSLDPDQQIRQSLRLVFDTFEQSASAMAVVKRFRREALLFPRRVRGAIRKGDLVWALPNHSRILQVLHNPRYAGAFVFGRTRATRNAQLKQRQIKVAREDWLVFIPQAHDGYISWEQYERNQARLSANLLSLGELTRGSMPREGPGLLQGRVLCGICGARMRMRYQVLGDRRCAYYVCTEESVRNAGKHCQSIRGEAVDRAISVLLLDTLRPAAIALALCVQQEISERVRRADALRTTQLERARYEAELARQRYMAIDPRNRLVADQLEADWNERLRRLEALTLEQQRQRKADEDLLTEDAQQRLAALTRDFARVWNDPRTAALDRKRMLALLIEDVTLIKDADIGIHVRMRGGRTCTLSAPRPMPIALIRKTRPEVVRALDQLLETCTDREAAEQLKPTRAPHLAGTSVRRQEGVAGAPGL